MAKKLCIMLLIVALICVFTSCSDDDNKCEHTYVESVAKEATCAKYGDGTKGDKKFTCSICNYSYIQYSVIPVPEHEWIEATCTEPQTCKACGKTEGYYGLGHDYSEKDGTCTRCGYGTKFIVPNTPVTVSYENTKECKIVSIKIERVNNMYDITFVIESTYHIKGNNYSDSAIFGWKLYDEDGLVVDSGSGYSDGKITVGEKSKYTLTFYSSNGIVKNGKIYRLELLDIG